MIERSSKFYEFLNKHKWIYLSIGIILFAGGAFVLALKDERFLIEAAGHFQLILGEALIVFFIINVVLEQEAREAIVKQISDVVQKQEQKLIESVTATTAEVSRQEQQLTQKIFEVSAAITAQENNLRGLFDNTAKTLIAQSEELTNKLNHNLFKIILSERTCDEIATQMNNIEFFKPGFMIYDYTVTFTFKYNEKTNSVTLEQEDDFCAKNFAKQDIEYMIRFSTYSADTKVYEFVEAGLSPDTKKSNYKPLEEKDFDKYPIKELTEGVQYELKSAYRPAVKPGAAVKAYLKLKTTFKEFNGSVSDYSFTNLYMMPSKLEVTVPKGFTFNLYPTFHGTIEEEQKRLETKVYKLPFITPGQGYNFSLIKQ